MALRQAARTALGEIIEAQLSIAENREAPEISKLDKLWKLVNQTADIALKAEHIAQLGQKAWAVLEKLI